MSHISFEKIWTDDERVLLEARKNGGLPYAIYLDDDQIGQICPGSAAEDNQQGNSERNPADYFELYLEVDVPYETTFTTLAGAKAAARDAVISDAVRADREEVVSYLESFTLNGG